MDRRDGTSREAATARARSNDRHVRQTLALLDELLESYRPRDFAVRLWDGTLLEAESAEPLFTMKLNHPGALRRMFLPPNDSSLGEAFIYDDFDIDGQLDGALGLAQYLLQKRWDLRERMLFARRLLLLPGGKRESSGRGAASLSGARHSRSRDRRAVTYHYDVGNDFFSLFLGDTMVYSCAYFSHGEDDVDAAQARKLDYICRKLRLRPGERLLDIGCGWGSLVLHAAKHYGVEATGITLSEPQAEWARRRISAEGLIDSCRVEVRDYRELDEGERFEKLVSVGMFEHVGEARLTEYFARAWQLLRPGGAMLNHGIARRLGSGRRRPASRSFSQRYVFPDGELVPISTTLRMAEASGFEVRDLESLREHYALTLERWLRRLEARREEALRLVDEVTYRVWRLFIALSIRGFRNGDSNLYQALLVKPERGESGLPLTRGDWYALDE